MNAIAITWIMLSLALLVSYVWLGTASVLVPFIMLGVFLMLTDEVKRKLRISVRLLGLVLALFPAVEYFLAGNIIACLVFLILTGVICFAKNNGTEGAAHDC